MTNQELTSWAAELLRAASKHIKENAPEMLFQHEGVEVDGLCFAEECKAAADELEDV